MASYNWETAKSIKERAAPLRGRIYRSCSPPPVRRPYNARLAGNLQPGVKIFAITWDEIDCQNKQIDLAFW